MFFNLHTYLTVLLFIFQISLIFSFFFFPLFSPLLKARIEVGGRHRSQIRVSSVQTVHR